ncbi:hypothetical protein NRIC_06780 [Enterococcus florum]|uniref:Helicase Helix-turn-helix domain-containing protein n=1 Tax=Enterococcus florum TaxID=2480627 RepID=A0A4P5P4P3_9ENTE|nr:helix-turn-helix domain-containing protein [Enterococcus florum]GCF92787.1 hypothetical protein NRIC_06780 [Enterococcus florum]
MTLFILSLFHTGHKLRISTLYHLLVGKRTSSVQLHGFFFQNLGYFGALPELTETQFYSVIQRLNKAGLILETDGFGQLTTKGKNYLEEGERPSLEWINGLRFGRGRAACWQMTLLALQVVSHLSYHEKNYLPIESRPFYLNHVKNWLANSSSALFRELIEELEHLLAKLPQEQSDFLANQFSGKDLDGRVPFQIIPEKWQDSPWRELYSKNAVDRFLSEIPHQPNLFRLLKPLDQVNYNQSMLRTQDLFLAGNTFEQIMEKRKLKEGTINDHLIEWALLDEKFPFDRFELIFFSGETQVVQLSHKAHAELPYVVFRLSQIHSLKELRK